MPKRWFHRPSGGFHSRAIRTGWLRAGVAAASDYDDHPIEDKTAPPDDPDWTEIPGWFAPREGLLLQAAVRDTPEDAVLVELGTWCGRSAACMADAADRRRLYTVDDYAEASQAAQTGDAIRDGITPEVARREAARHLDPKGVRRIFDDSTSAAAAFPAGSVALLFVDDHHEAAHTLRVIDAWLPRLAPEAFVLLHDWTLFGLAVACAPALQRAGFRMDAQAFTLARWRRRALDHSARAATLPRT